MSSVIKHLEQHKLTSPPRWLTGNLIFEAQTGSTSYGVANDESDWDIVGWTIPPKEDLFPSGYIHGFGKEVEPFSVFQHHHVKDSGKQREYDLTVYSLVKFMTLAMENNPNALDILFTPRRCILFSTPVAEHVRESRKSFLHKGAFSKHKGYAFSQLHKIDIKTNAKNEKRAESIRIHGFDLKFAMHTCRLLSQCEQILLEGDLNLEDVGRREMLKAIRRGEWSLEQIKTYFSDKERHLEEAYAKSNLPAGPDEIAIKKLLLESLEQHYGSLDKAVVIPERYDRLIQEMQELLDRYK